MAGRDHPCLHTCGCLSLSVYEVKNSTGFCEQKITVFVADSKVDTTSSSLLRDGKTSEGLFQFQGSALFWAIHNCIGHNPLLLTIEVTRYAASMTFVLTRMS